MLVKTGSLYAAIYDERSPVNVEGFMSDLLLRAKNDPQANAFGGGGSLFLFNGYLMEHARRGELLPWTLLLDGVFNCDAQVAPSAPQPAAPIQNLGLDELAGVLKVPSGRLVVSCLGDLGKRHSPILHVDPGGYHVAIRRISEREARHWFIDSEADYPANDGPDWVIRLSRVQGESAGT